MRECRILAIGTRVGIRELSPRTEQAVLPAAPRRRESRLGYPARPVEVSAERTSSEAGLSKEDSAFGVFGV